MPFAWVRAFNGVKNRIFIYAIVLMSVQCIQRWPSNNPASTQIHSLCLSPGIMVPATIGVTTPLPPPPRHIGCFKIVPASLTLAQQQPSDGST